MPASDDWIENYWKSRQGWFDWPELYDRVVASLPESGGVVVEVGVWRARSLCYLLSRCRKSGKDIRVVGVDHFRGADADPWYFVEALSVSDVERECRNSVRLMDYPCEIIKEPSTAAAKLFARRSVDFVFIDASHDEKSVLADIRAWRPAVKPGGAIAGHDRDHAGVKNAVAKLLPGAVPDGKSCWHSPIGK